MPSPLRLLFVCIENANRSQMAEAFACKLGGDRVEACSAGSRPSGQINPRAVAFMAEVGCNLKTQASKGFAQLPGGVFDVVVTMGCGDACPNISARRREDWAIPDPKDMSESDFRLVRDLIAIQVQNLLRDLGLEVVYSPGD